MTFSDITVAQCKTYFNYQESNRDAQIAMMMPMAADYIKQYCQHDFESKARVEIPIIDDSKADFYLNYRPVASITSVVEAGVTLVKNTDYKIDLATGRMSKINGDDYNPIFKAINTWSTEPEDITVTYTGGIELKQDVVQVYLEIVGIYSQINLRTYVNIAGEEITTSKESVPKTLTDVLDRYKYFIYGV